MRFKIRGKRFQILESAKAAKAFERYTIVQTPMFGIGINSFTTTDGYDFPPHDHQNDFFSIALRGGYTEQIWDNPAEDMDTTRTVTRRVFSSHMVPHSIAHRVLELHPPKSGRVTTLVFNRRRTTRLPSYYTREGVIPFFEFWDVDDFKTLLTVEVSSLKPRRGYVV